MRPTSLRAIALGLALALPCEAILIHPDRDDAEYLELASRYPSSVRIEATGGEGVLIAPRWILTSARRAKRLEGAMPWAPLDIGGRTFAIQAFFAHSAWKGGAEHDIALVLLRAPVAGVEPARLHRDGGQRGKAIVVVGHGESGAIGARELRSDRRRRAAINTIERETPRTFALAIKPPDDASDLQGAAAPGDQGGPAFTGIETGLVVTGIFSSSEDANRNGIDGDIGDRQWYVRVPPYVDWIEETMFRAAAAEAARPERPGGRR